MGKKVENKTWRFERKYQLTLQEYLQFEKLMMLSDLKILHPDRYVNNCYFDTVTNSSYSESIEGYSEKMKVRIRWYGQLFNTVTPVLEFKIKQNHSNKKESFKLFKTLIDNSMNWNAYSLDVLNYIQNQYNLTILNRLEPVLINTYKRSYYTNFQKTFRLTVDREMRFMNPNDTLYYKSPKTVEFFIVELKSDNKNVLKSFPINKNLGKFSKFTTGLQLVR